MRPTHRIENKGDEAKYALTQDESRCGTHENKAFYAVSTAANYQDEATESSRQRQSGNDVHT